MASYTAPITLREMRAGERAGAKYLGGRMFSGAAEQTRRGEWGCMDEKGPGREQGSRGGGTVHGRG